MLSQLSVYHVRNLEAVTINLAQCNVFIGANGSGKTSLLESLHVLSRGKSFRHHQPKRYISHHQPHATVFAKFSDGGSMAIQKSQDASTIMRLDQQTVYTQSPLAKRLPTLLIDPSSMDVLEIGSSSRRQMLDWIAFHVKPEFHPQWVAYQRLLRQRNALLKQVNRLSTGQKQELAAWDEGLAIHADLITHLRQSVFEDWATLFNALIATLLPAYAPYIRLRFSPGYNTDLSLATLLQQRVDQDCQMGYTRIGCHRADVQVLWVDDEMVRQHALTLESQKSVNHPSQTSINTQHFIYVQKNRSMLSSSTDALKPISLAVPESTLNPHQKVAISVGAVREQAANVLSRGEKKLLITALRLSQLPLLMTSNEGSDTSIATSHNADKNHNRHHDSKKTEAHQNILCIQEQSKPSHTPSLLGSASRPLPLVLLDDITAELDKNALKVLLQSLSQLSCQIFITSLDESVVKILQSYWQDIKVFHVKQGTINSHDTI